MKELLESIQKDGVEAAEKQAKQLLDEAREQADAIISEANQEAEDIVKQAKKEASRIDQSTRSALVQASRDTLLALEQKIIAVCEAALVKETNTSIDSELLAKLAEEAVKSEAVSAGEVQLEFSTQDAKKVHEILKKSLEPQLKEGLDLSTNSALTGGFIIRQKDGEGYYDFSIERIAQLISVHVNKYLSQLIREASSKGE
ncbi:MAG: hypothetical protein ACQEQU_02705 [Spirochaetota bacterium]